jgi:BirA family biotin operon repressor/biotin-[acetyl-CoA-carboxylase] ligase
MTGRLDAALLRTELQTSRIAWRVFVHDELQSTNDSVGAMARGGAAEGLVVFAERQQAGRGRFGRGWSFSPGESLAFSILLRPRLAAEYWPRLATCAAVGVAGGLDNFSPGELPRIKWPNDILLRGKKVAGILIETGQDEAGNRFAVVGIGLNVNQTSFPAELTDRAISLRQVIGTPCDRHQVAAGILAACAEVYGEIDDFTAIRDEAISRSAVMGNVITARMNEEVVSGIAEGLDENGALLMRRENGALVALSSGEVTLRSHRD